MSEFVRVRTEAGEASLSRGFVDGLNQGAVEVLDEPATDRRGRPRPATRKNGRPVKPRTTVDQEVARRVAADQQELATGADSDSDTGSAAGSPEEGKE